jgi:hypothetical protein
MTIPSNAYYYQFAAMTWAQDGIVYRFGGLSLYPTTSDTSLWKINLNDNTYTQVVLSSSTQVPVRVVSAALVYSSEENLLYLLGGIDINLWTRNTLWSFDLQDSFWYLPRSFIHSSRN